MSLTKRVDDARKGFASGDSSLSAAAHTPDRIAAAAREEHGGAAHQYLGELVLGGLDGIITTFAVVSGVAGAKLGSNVVLILGLANMFADGFSMATGTFLSSRSEQEYYDRERQREAWEVEHFPEGERAELYEIYRVQGYSEPDARRMMEIQAQDPKRWVDAMMVTELRLLPSDRRPILSALATFIAFVLAGAVPLLVYLLGLIMPVPADIRFPISLALSGVALFGLGSAKVLVTERNVWRSGAEMLLVGGLAAGVAYAVGYLLKDLGV